ncbi:MAG: hypothetical protein ACP5TW_06475, partial [Thermoplasmata archaeon]
LFQKQAVISIVSDIKLKNFKFIIKGKTIYYDFLTAEHYFSVSENDPGYSKLILDGKEIGLKFNKKGNIYWVSFYGETLKNDEIAKKFEGRNLREIKKGMVFPLILNKDGRLYYLYQYAEDAESDVSTDLILIQNAYDDIFGPGIFRIEKIGNVEKFANYFKYGHFDQTFYEMELSVPHNGPDFIGIL